MLRLVAGAAFIITTAAMLVAVLAHSSANAQEPEGAQPCLPTLPNDASVDPRLDIDIGASGSVATRTDDPAHSNRPVDEVTLRWNADLSAAECVWIGGPTSSFSLVRVPPQQQQVSFLASGNPGTICYRLVPVSEAGIGRTTEVCLDIRNPQGPVSPGSGAHPPGPPNTGQGFVNDEGRSVWLAAFLVLTGTIAGVLILRTVHGQY